MGLLHGLWMLADVAELDGGSVEVRVVCPESSHCGEVFVGSLGSGLERHAEGCKFGLDFSGCDTDDQSPVAHSVDAGELLGEQYGLALGKDQHPDAEADTICDRGEIGERRQSFETRFGGSVGCIWWQCDVITDPERLETHLFASSCDVAEASRFDVVAAVERVESEFHAHARSNTSTI
jgi:hypothetical protein